MWYFDHFLDFDKNGHSLVNPYALAISVCSFVALAMLPVAKKKWGVLVPVTPIQKILQVRSSTYDTVWNYTCDTQNVYFTISQSISFNSEIIFSLYLISVVFIAMSRLFLQCSL